MTTSQPTTNTVDADIRSLIQQLSSSEAIGRQRARFALVAMGPQAVPQVAALVDSTDDQTRWEAAKTLAAIADPTAVDALITLLDDSDPGTCWDASVGLTAIGKAAVTPLMRAIIDRSNRFTILAGAHNVIHEFTTTDWGTFLKPVLEALESSEPEVRAPVAASAALQTWEYSELTGDRDLRDCDQDS